MAGLGRRMQAMWRKPSDIFVSEPGSEAYRFRTWACTGLAFGSCRMVQGLAGAEKPSGVVRLEANSWVIGLGLGRRQEHQEGPWAKL